jgi:hypothetical protein
VVGQRCYADVLYDDEVCTMTARYVALLDHSAMPHYLCGEHMAQRLRDWPDSIVWMRELPEGET